MSRGADVRSIDKIVTLADGRRLEGAEIRSKNVQRLNRSSAILRGSKLKFFYSRKLRIGIPAFVMGFLACGWLNIVNKPPPVVVKKVVRKKKPKLTIEEIPDEEPEDPSGGGGAEMTARPGEEMKMVLVVNDSLGMSAGKACSSPLNENLVMCLFFRKPHSHKNIVSYAHRFFFFFFHSRSLEAAANTVTSAHGIGASPAASLPRRQDRGAVLPRHPRGVPVLGREARERAAQVGGRGAEEDRAQVRRRRTAGGARGGGEERQAAAPSGAGRGAHAGGGGVEDRARHRTGARDGRQRGHGDAQTPVEYE